MTDIAGFNVLYLPVSPVPGVVNYAFNFAMRTVNRALWQTGMFTDAVYNLGTSLVINFAQDQPGRDFFLKLKKQLEIGAFTPGVVSSTSDQSTGKSLLNPEFMKNLTLQDLQTLKDPWGRAYLGMAQAYGPTVWGLI